MNDLVREHVARSDPVMRLKSMLLQYFGESTQNLSKRILYSSKFWQGKILGVSKEKFGKLVTMNV